MASNLDSSDVTYSGYLFRSNRRSATLKTMKTEWVELKGGVLSFFKKKRSKKASAVFDLRVFDTIRYNLGRMEEGMCKFTIYPGATGKLQHLFSLTKAETIEWIKHIENFYNESENRLSKIKTSYEFFNLLKDICSSENWEQNQQQIVHFGRLTCADIEYRTTSNNGSNAAPFVFKALQTENIERHLQFLEWAIKRVSKRSHYVKALIFNKVPIEGFLSALKEIFFTFASNENGTMSMEDFRRYILAMGAGTYMASEDAAIQRTMQYRDPSVMQLSLSGFIDFYSDAAMDRAEHVWNDLRVFGYNDDFKLECVPAKIEFVTNILSVLDCIKLKQNVGQYALGFVRKIFLDLLMMFPRSKEIEKEFYDLVKPMTELFEYGKDKMYTICYKLLVLDVVCHRFDDEWRKKFIEMGGFDHLMKIFKFYHVNGVLEEFSEDQEIHLGFAILIKVLYYFCCSSQQFVETTPMHLFRRKAQVSHRVRFQNISLESKQMLFDIIHCDANVQDIEILDVLPHTICEMQTKLLVSGYIVECNIDKDIPKDIVRILSRFFF